MPSPCDAGMAECAHAGGKAPAHPNLVLATCILASSLAFIEGGVLNVALPAIGANFRAGAAEVQWVINAFTLPLSALLLLGGAAGDRYGRRLCLALGMALFALSSILCALAPSLAVFLAGRALQGMGAALVLPNSLAILGAAFEGERRGRAVGLWAALGAVAGAVAPPLGGWLVDRAGWPSVFYINLPVVAAAMLLAFRYVPESVEPARAPPDWAGAAAATGGLGALACGLTLWSGGRGGHGAAIGWVVVGAALTLLFLWQEKRRGDGAMMPLSLFASRRFAGLTLLTFLLYGAFGGMLVLLPYVLIEAAGYSALQAGSALLPLPLVIATLSPLTGRLAARVGPRLPLTIAPLIVAAAFLLTLRIDGQAAYVSQVLPAVALMALGMAFAAAPLTTAVLGSVDERHTGTASGLNSAVSRSGGLIATALLGAVLGGRGAALIDGFHNVAIVAAAISAAASATALVLLGRD
jgi:EmrB/QacA subfamily drug resistance transporter